MSNKIDVLAVMRLASQELAQFSLGDDLVDARDAVAELIVQAEKADKMLHNAIEAYIPAYHNAAWQADAADFRAALAAVRD